MSDGTSIQYTLLFSNNCDNVIATSAISVEDAKQLADLYLALAQLYRRIAGLQPVPTAAHQRKVMADRNR